MKPLRIFLVAFALFALLASTALASRPSVTADDTYFDFSSGLYHLKGNVRVAVKDIVITANKARFSMTNLEVWAEGGISASHGDIAFYGDTAYIKGFDRLAIISGNTRFERGNMTVVAGRVEYNWKTKLATFSDGVTLTNENGTSNPSILTYNVKTNQIL